MVALIGGQVVVVSGGCRSGYIKLNCERNICKMNEMQREKTQTVLIQPVQEKDETKEPQSKKLQNYKFQLVHEKHLFHITLSYNIPAKRELAR